MAATPLGALLAPAIARRTGGEQQRRTLAALGVASGLYMLASLFAVLWWLEPWLAGPAGGEAIRSSTVLQLGVMLSPPFIVCAAASAHATSTAAKLATTPHQAFACCDTTRQPQPQPVEFVLAAALLGSAAGSALAHYWGQWVGVNSLLILTSLCLPLLLLGMPRLSVGLALALAGSAVPTTPVPSSLDNDSEKPGQAASIEIAQGLFTVPPYLSEFVFSLSLLSLSLSLSLSLLSLSL